MKKEPHELEDDTLLKEFEEFREIIIYGDPHSVTSSDKERFEKIKAELIFRAAKYTID